LIRPEFRAADRKHDLFLAGMRWQRRMGSSQTYRARSFRAGAASVDIVQDRQKTLWQLQLRKLQQR